jgi:hypothetical protein
LATVRWVASGAPHIDYLGVALPLAGGELYHFDSFTSPSFRRRSVSTVSQDELVKALRADATVRLVRAVHPRTEPRCGTRP